MRFSPFRRFVSLLLAVLVLITSVGLTVQRHTCRISGRSQVAVAVPGQAALRGCAALAAPARPVAKSNCCDLSSQVHKLSASAHEVAAKVLVPVPVLLAWQPEAVRWQVAAAAAVPATAGPRWFAADSSPPRSGRGLLAFVCTLVV